MTRVLTFALGILVLGMPAHAQEQQAEPSKTPAPTASKPPASPRDLSSSTRTTASP